MRTHACPAQRCTQRVPQDQLACPRHWPKLPWRTRRDLREAWRLNDYSAHQAALEAALAWYALNDADAAPESRGGHTSTTLEAGTITSSSQIESGGLSYSPWTSSSPDTSSSSSDSGSSFGGGE